jgi:sugar-phosphatase
MRTAFRRNRSWNPLLADLVPRSGGREPGSTADVSAVLFDLDGVLVDSVAVYRCAWASWAERYGISEKSIWADAHGRRPRDIIARVAPTIPPETALAAFDSALETQRHRCAAMAGARECLDALDVPWAIVTSGRRCHVPGVLKSAEIPQPQVLVCGDDVTRGKPHPDGFLRAATQLSVTPSSCVVVEDAPKGITAALAAGMHAIGVATTHRSQELSAAEVTFPNLTAAAPYLLRLAGQADGQ